MDSELLLGCSAAVAVTTYRRANGSQVQVVKPRVGQRRTPKVFPRAHTPSQTARQNANIHRKNIDDPWL